MPVAHPTRQPYSPALQADALLNQAAPVQNTWYTVLNTTNNGFLYAIAFGVADTGEDLEYRITIDGVVKVNSQIAVAGTVYVPLLYLDYNSSYYIAAVGATISRIDIWFKTLKVEVRKTSANGAGNLKASVLYALW